MTTHSIDEIEVYLVGGAVRDELLGRAVEDRDWVVVGANTVQMLELGFQQVGRDFPVFLHPHSKDEYALARTERKQGAGHTGFVVHAAEDVTLEEDLVRRDLTINAIARLGDDNYFDPFGGVEDVRSKTLRHVSSSFSEDPLRILRVARFAAQLPDFTVAQETMALLTHMCGKGDLADLSAERVWQELHKVLSAASPNRFFAVLKECGGLADWFVELIGQDMSVFAATPVDPLVRFCQLPLSGQTIDRFSERLKVPNDFQQAFVDKLNFSSLLTDWRSASAPDLESMFGRLRVRHDQQRLKTLVQVSSANSGINFQSLVDDYCAQHFKVDLPPGPEYGRALKAMCIEAIKQLLAKYSAL